MAAIRDVEVDAIEAARRSVIELTLAHQTTARVARKQAVKDLFGTLLASWEAGVSFDKMAGALTASGVPITTETLRSYFFELKTAEQLRAENDAHKRAMDKIRRDSEAQQRVADLQHARALAQAGTELASRAREAKVEAAAAQVVEAARRGSSGASSSVGMRKQPMRESGPARGGAQPGGQAVASQPKVGASATGSPNVGSGAAPEVKVQVPAAVDRVPVQPEMGMVNAAAPELDASSSAQTGESPAAHAKTLDEIARASQGQKETPYGENLVLKEGDTVWYESGKPFDGYLSPRTIHTLRTVGRVIAPTEGRSSKDFVPMSHEL